MHRLRAIVVDDEPHARADLVELLTRRNDCTVAATYATGDEAVAALGQVDADVLFLDIRMPGLDGLAMAERLRPARHPQVVFVTAFDRYAVDAFAVRAIDYLLKPVHPARLDEALARVRERIATPTRDPAPAYRREILVRIGAREVVVAVDDLDWIEADTYCVRLHAGARTFVVRERMHALESSLDPGCFARIHRSAIVNIGRIREIVHEGRGEHVVVLATGVRIRTSLARWTVLRDRWRDDRR